MPAIANPIATPAEELRVCRLRNGALVHLRPIRPEDTELERNFLSHLSPEYRAYRFLGLIKSPSYEVAKELTHTDPEEVVLAAMVENQGRNREVGVARFRPRADGESCDCAVTVDPEWQHLGVGSLLMRNLIDAARSRGMHWMYAVDPARCLDVHKLAERLGFQPCVDPEDPVAASFKLDLR